MARRRLNTKFLGIALTLLVVLAGSALAYKKFHRRNPMVFKEAGERALKVQDWRAAADNFGQAAALLPKDAGLLMQFGMAAGRVDLVEYRQRSMSAFRQAAQLDPQRPEAWLAMAELAQGEVDYMLDPSRLQGAANRERLTRAMGTLREAGAKVVTLQAGSTDAAARGKAQAVLPILNIQQWMMNIPIPQTAEERALPLEKQQTDEQKVNASVVELTKILQDDPGNVRAANAIAQAKIRQAQQALQRGQQTDAFTLLGEAAAVCDAPLQADPKNVLMHWARYEILARLTQVDPRPEKRKEYDKGARESLETAQSLVDPKDAGQYVRIKQTWAGVLASTDAGRAHQVLQDVIDRFPDEIPPKIVMARVLQKYGTRREEALKVLESVPEAAPQGTSPMRRAYLEEKIYQAKLTRTDIQIDLYVLAGAGPDAERLAAAINKTLDALSSNFGEDWRFLKLKGRFQLKSGKTRDAIQTLATADRFMGQNGAMDVELLKLEADAYQFGQQNSEAIKVLRRAIEADSTVATNVGVRVVLARLYLDDRRVSEAKPHLDWLEKAIPGHPEVVKLRLRSLDVVGDKEAALKLYQQLPETTPEESMEKVRVARALGNEAEVERILKALHEANPKDIPAIVRLGSFYLQNQRKDEAQRLVDEALKVNPDDPSLRYMVDSIAGKADEAMNTLRQQIASQPDKFKQELGYAGLARTQGKSDQELQHLLEAEKLQPGNAAVLQRLYDLHVAARDFDKAEAITNKLAAIDADQAHGLLYKLNLALLRNEVQAAVAIGRQLTNDFKEFSSSWEALGEALQAAGQYDAAVNQYKVALDKQGSNIKALQRLVDCNYKLNRLDDARQAIADAKAKFPDNPVFRELEVKHQLRFGDPDTVLPLLRDDLSKRPTDPKGYELLSAALTRAAAVKRSNGQPDAAAARLTESQDVLKQAVTRWPDELTYTLALADSYTQTGDFPAAETAIKTLADRPRWKDVPTPTLALAELYTRSRKPEMAEAALRSVLTRYPDSIDLQLKLSNVLQLQRKYDEALKVLDSHLDRIAVRRARSELLVSAGRAAQAESELNAAVLATPNNAQLNDLLLFVLVNGQKFDEARKLATQIIASNPGNLIAYYYRAQVNMSSPAPDLEAAMTDLMYVRERMPDNLESRIALADCYARKGDVEGGIRELETVLRSAPDSKEVRVKLLDLYAAADPPHWIDAESTIRDGMAIPQYKDDADLLRRAASMWARRGDATKALDAMRKAMAAVPNQAVLIREYLDILLTTRNFDQLALESNALVAAPNCPWWVYDYRARAKARSGDKTAAVTEFNSALNAAGTEATLEASKAVSRSIKAELGGPKAIELIGPRAQNSARWKLVAIPLYDTGGDRAGAIKMGESALTSSDTLKDFEKDELHALLAAMYLTSDPPVVDKAVAIYEQILQRHPHDYMSMNNLAYVLSEQSNPPKLKEALDYAQKAFDEAQKTGNPNLMVVDTRAWLLIQNGRVDEGIAILHEIVDRATFPDAHYHLAEGYLRKKLPEDAQRELRAAMEKIEAAKAAKQPIEASLEAKWQSARQRADKMVADKTQAKAAP